MPIPELFLACTASAGITAGIAYSQRANPYTKHFVLVCTCALMILCVVTSTDSMMQFLPWAIWCALLLSALYHGLSKGFQGFT